MNFDHSSLTELPPTIMSCSGCDFKVDILFPATSSSAELQAILDSDPNRPLTIIVEGVDETNFDGFVLLMAHTKRMKCLGLKVHHRWIQELIQRQNITMRSAPLLAIAVVHIAYDPYTPSLRREDAVSLKELFHGELPSLLAWQLTSEIDVDGPPIPNAPNLRSLDLSLKDNPPSCGGRIAHTFNIRNLVESLRGIPKLEELCLRDAFGNVQVDGEVIDAPPVFLSSLKEFSYIGSAGEFPLLAQWLIFPPSCTRMTIELDAGMPGRIVDVDHLAAVLRTAFTKTLPRGDAIELPNTPCLFSISASWSDKRIRLSVCPHASQEECELSITGSSCRSSFYRMHLISGDHDYSQAILALVTSIPFACNIKTVSITGRSTKYPGSLLLENKEQEHTLFENLAHLPKVRRLDIDTRCLSAYPGEQKLREILPALQEVKVVDLKYPEDEEWMNTRITPLEWLYEPAREDSDKSTEDEGKETV